MNRILKLARRPTGWLIIIYQSFMLALHQIWSNKLRSILTMLGIIIGVASVTSVIAALTGLQQKVLSDFETVGANKIFINIDRPETGPMRKASWRSLQFKPQHFETFLAHCPSVRRFARGSWLQETIRHADRTEESVPVYGIEPAWHSIEKRSVTLGRQFTTIDEGRAVCLVSPRARDKLALPRDPVGASVQIGGRRYTVVGVVDPPTQMNLFGDGKPGMEVFIPFTTSWKIRPGNMTVTAEARSPEVSEEAQAETEFFLRRQKRLKPGDPDTFRVDVMQRIIDQFNQTASTMTLVAVGIVGISLIVGGVGIMNIMLVSVSERTREIGLRKAVGARPSAILLQFLVEAVALCLVGGSLGVLGGEGIAHLLASVPGAGLEKTTVPPWAVALAFGFAATVGLVFGMLPAVKASRLDPIEALRHT